MPETIDSTSQRRQSGLSHICAWQRWREINDQDLNCSFQQKREAVVVVSRETGGQRACVRRCWENTPPHHPTAWKCQVLGQPLEEAPGDSGSLKLGWPSAKGKEKVFLDERKMRKMRGRDPGPWREGRGMPLLSWSLRAVGEEPKVPQVGGA